MSFTTSAPVIRSGKTIFINFYDGSCYWSHNSATEAAFPGLVGASQIAAIAGTYVQFFRNGAFPIFEVTSATGWVNMTMYDGYSSSGIIGGVSGVQVYVNVYSPSAHNDWSPSGSLAVAPVVMGSGYPKVFPRLNLAVKTNANRGDAALYGAGNMIWNSDDNAPNFSDGTNWRDAAGNVK
jgi:hypothetical protein